MLKCKVLASLGKISHCGMVTVCGLWVAVAFVILALQTLGATLIFVPFILRVWLLLHPIKHTHTHTPNLKSSSLVFGCYLCYRLAMSPQATYLTVPGFLGSKMSTVNPTSIGIFMMNWRYEWKCLAHKTNKRTTKTNKRTTTTFK